MVELSLYLHNRILSHRAEFLSQCLLRGLHVEEANKIFFPKFPLRKRSQNHKRKSGREKTRCAEIQGLGELNYISREATGWAYSTQHACVPALETRSLNPLFHGARRKLRSLCWCSSDGSYPANYSEPR